MTRLVNTDTARYMEIVMTKKLPRILLSVAAFSAGQSASALQLGQVVVESTRGQPLSAYVVLFGAPPAHDIALGVEVLPAFGVDATDVRGRLVIEGGTARIALDSAVPVSAAELGLRIRLREGRASRVQNFTLQLPPPAVPVRPVRTQDEPRHTRPHGGAHADAAAVSPTPRGEMTAGNFGPVRPGQTLWGILQRQGLAHGDIEARMREVVAANPTAFAESDPNRLRVGALLDLSHVSAHAAVTAPADTPSATTSKVAVETRPQSGVESTAPAAPVTIDAETAARLAALSEKFAAIRARYAAQSQHQDVETRQAAAATTSATDAKARATNAAPQPSPSSASASADTAAQTQGSAAAAAARRDTATSNKPTATAPVVIETTAEQGTSNMGIALGIAAVLALLAAVGVTALRALTRRRRQAGQLSSDSDLIAEISRKTEQRLQLEDEVKRMVAGRRDPDRTSAPPASVIERVIAHGTDTVSIDEVESRIAHGQYNEAEAMLEQIIAASPNNFRAKLRLAEIYYLNERHEEFVELAEEIYSRHRSDIGDDNWQRVMRMGKMVAPDRPPFSGPVMVNGARQHA